MTARFAAISLLLLAGCQPARQDAVRVSGASTVYPIVQLAAEKLQADQRLRVQVQAGGSTRGFMDTLAGRNDLGAIARELTDEESEQVRAFPIAQDGVGVVVHEENSLSALRTEDLCSVYRKQVTDWGKLGGPAGAIVVVTKAEGHGTLQAFLDHTGLKRDEVRADVVAGNNAQVIQTISTQPRAIGYVSMGEVLHARAAGMRVRLVALDGVAPSLEAVAAQTWPIRRTLYLVSKQAPAGGSLALLDYLRSDPGRTIIKRGGYVPMPE